jgi:hypothetical protein
MTSAHNERVICYPDKWVYQQLEQDLDAVYDMDANDGVYLDALFELLEESQAVRLAVAEGQFRRISDPRFDTTRREWAKKRG